MTAPLNDSEAFVNHLCQKTFLSMWCYNNPLNSPGKELCDVLMVCGPHVVVVSVKDIDFKDDAPDPQLAHERWERKAIDASVRQIYGAEKWLARESQVIRSDGTPGLELPPLTARRTYRIAVAFGSKDKLPVTSQDFGKGFVHVMTESSILEVLTELDTVTDLIEYLAAKEDCLNRGPIMIEGGESNLIGLYIANERKFPAEGDLVMVMDDIWENLKAKPEFILRKEADKPSYQWDRLIEFLSDPIAKEIGNASTKLSELELALRRMALENRFARRQLGNAFVDFVEKAVAGKVRSRMLVNNHNHEVIYVLVYFGSSEDYECQHAELMARCYIARMKYPTGRIVIGIGIARPLVGGTASAIAYVDIPEWTDEFQQHALQLQARAFSIQA